MLLIKQYKGLKTQVMQLNKMYKTVCKMQEITVRLLILRMHWVY